MVGFPWFSSHLFAAALRIVMTMKLRSWGAQGFSDETSQSKAEDELKM